MARSVPDTLFKRSSKFESFLKKNLDEDTFEKVRAYEACIVVSEKEKNAFKFMVLSDERVYLTENPPKTIAEAVHFRDVLQVDLVNDYPDFLSGDQRLNTQHIAITYKTELPLKKRGKSPNPSPRNGGDLKKTNSTGWSLFRRKSDDKNNGNSPRSMSAVELKQEHFGGSLDDDALNAMKDMNLTDEEVENEPKISLSKSMPALQLRKLGLTHQKSLDSSQKKRPLPTRPENTTVPKFFIETDDDTEVPNRRISPEPGNDKDKPLRKRSNNSQTNLPNNSNSDLESSKSSLQIPTLDLSEVEDDTFENNETELGEAILHIYILNLNSPMLMLIKCAFHNYLIRSTLLLDEMYVERVTPSPRRLNLDSEKLVLLFGQLKRELLSPDNEMEDVFRLTRELKTATEKNYSLKKIFWKSSDLFSFIIRQLQRYLPKSPNNIHTDQGRSQRADEFELVIMLVGTLSLMFRETDNFPARLQCLKVGKGKAALDLLIVLTCFPDVPQKYKPPTSKAAALLMSTQSDNWKCLADAELSQLLNEYLSVSTAVLFELVLIAEQALIGDREDSFFNICWLIKVLEELRTTEKFIERVASQVFNLIAPSKRIELTPQEAILVFQQFYLLQTFIKYSPSMAAHIKNNYTEEFKYFVQAKVLAEKLPRLYPITMWTLSLIEKVTSHVLEKKVVLIQEGKENIV